MLALIAPVLQPLHWTTWVCERRSHAYKNTSIFVPLLHFCPEESSWNVSKFYRTVKLSAERISVYFMQIATENDVTSYYSHRLSKAERNSCVTRRELLAIVKAIQRFHPYLHGGSFTIRMDHAALCWLLNFKCPKGQVARWLEELQQYNFVVEYRCGGKHINADALSTCSCLPDECKYCERLETKEQLQNRPGKKKISFSGPPTSVFGCWAFFYN